MRLSQQHQAPIAAQSRPGHCRPLFVCCSASSGGDQQSGPSGATRRALSRRALSLRQQAANTQEANEDLAHDRRRRSWAARRFQEPPSSIAKEEDTEQEQSESSSTSQLLEAQRQLLKRIFQSRPEAWLDAPIAADVAIARPPSAPSAQKQCLQLEELPEKDTEEICSVEHPGTICCTSTTVTRDPAAMDVTLHLTTSVRLSNPHSPTSTSNVTLSDLEQLGCMAAVQHLHQQATQLAARNGSTTVQDRHEAVLRVLSQGHVVSAEKQTNQFGHVTFKVELEHPDTNEKMHAFVKPCVEDHGGGWHRAEVEAVAYRLNRLLGMDYVPPCAYRKQMDVDWTHFEHGGIFMYWAEGGEELRCTPMEQWPVTSEVVLSDARVLDVLLQNSDRHHGHFLMAEHWAQGGGARSPADPGWKGAMMPVFIDHAAGFRSEAFVHMKHQNAFNTGETARISARTFLRLRCLDRLAVSQALGDVLSPAEVDQVMRRREDILSYLDALVASRGYDKVVVEDHGPAWCSAPPSVPLQQHHAQQQQHGHHHH